MPNSKNYFTVLGQQIAALLARNPATRQQLKKFADGALRNHISGSLAHDQQTIDPDLEPRGGLNNGGGEVPSADECIEFIQLLLSKLPSDVHNQLISALAQLIKDAHNDGTADPNGGNGDGGGMGVGGINSSALDRSRRRSARDEENSINPGIPQAGRYSQRPDFDLVKLKTPPSGPVSPAGFRMRVR